MDRLLQSVASAKSTVADPEMPLNFPFTNTFSQTGVQIFQAEKILPSQPVWYQYMFVNRLFPFRQREYEMVLYHLLTKYYKSIPYQVTR